MNRYNWQITKTYQLNMLHSQNLIAPKIGNIESVHLFEYFQFHQFQIIRIYFWWLHSIYPLSWIMICKTWHLFHHTTSKVPSGYENWKLITTHQHQRLICLIDFFLSKKVNESLPPFLLHFCSTNKQKQLRQGAWPQNMLENDRLSKK